MKKVNYTAAGAMLSPCGTYRYSLNRGWDTLLPTAVWIGLNPSTADSSLDDPTIRRMVGYARQWGRGGILVLNLFALRATDPCALRSHPDPVGPDNDLALSYLATGQQLGPVVAAWGAHGSYRGRDQEVVEMCWEQGVQLYCLGLTKEGHPRHPLYCKSDLKLIPYNPGGSSCAKAST